MVNSVCNPETGPEIFHVVFTDCFVETWTDSVLGKIVNGGITAVEDLPLLIKQRGLYFNGIDDFLVINLVMLSHSFTLEFWVRPKESVLASDLIYLISISNDYFYFAIDNQSLRFFYENPAGTAITYNGNVVTLDTW